ncbi:glycosyltransferase [Botrimarina sp.]|uniref:glycosyltransferase n=1 Tax=Botrimarina sp. TaxID=2795802 RepID=UPI0032EEA268
MTVEPVEKRPSETTSPAADPLGARERRRIRLRLLKLRAREYLEYQSPVLGPAIRLAAWAAGAALVYTPARRRGFGLLAATHRSGRLRSTNWLVEGMVRRHARQGAKPVAAAIDHAIATADANIPAGLRKDPRNVFPTLAIVLRSPGERHKGVLNLSYSYVYPWFHKHYDVEKVASRYHIVLEPSWAGFCTPEILTFTRLSQPVFVQAIEPYDASYLQRVGGNLTPVAIAANWWTDPRVFAPAADGDRPYDFAMVASWSDFKRHHRFFAALAEVKRRGRRLNGVCVGYPQGRSVEEVRAVARLYGVSDWITFEDRLTPEQTAERVRRAKVKVLWSRREGFNRAVIEALFSDTPIVMREGFNYGHHHDYVNEQTGCFADERSLPDTLLRYADATAEASPEDWVSERMSPQAAVQRLHKKIAETAGEPIGDAGPLAVKVNTLNNMRYWNPTEAERHRSDYQWLAGCVRT